MAKITGAAARLLVEQFRCIIEKKGYTFFEGRKPYDVNIIGVRSDTVRANRFDDGLYVIYKNTLKDWEVRLYKITTDPGTYYLKNPMKVTGTAIVVPGQYRSAYKIGTHKTYEALVQRGKNPIKIYRDSNKDEMTLIRRSEKYWGEWFSYTLLEEKDFKDCK